MERKTMGSFIAALRKANGLTQKDLAERLHVSDKSISRWEREEGAPDLSLIPVLAEIFGVTCDELLRGERQQSEPRDEGKPDCKTDKQRQRILSVSLAKYRNRSLLAAGLAKVGLLTALTCNFGFHRAYLGFLLGSVFYLAAVLCQAVWINGAFLAVSDDEMAGPNVERFKHSAVSLGEKVMSLVVVLWMVSLPLILYPTDTYQGLTAESWLFQGALPFGLAGLVLCGVACYFLTHLFQKKGVFVLPEQETAAYLHNFKLQRTCALFLLVALCVTLLVGAAATGFGDLAAMADGTSFTDYPSFTAYMEQEIPAVHTGIDGADSAPERDLSDSGSHYYDAQGNEVTRDESLTRTIQDQDGNVVCTYIQRNESVWSLRYGHPGGKVLPITVFTQDDILAARQKTQQIHCIVAAVAAAEVLTALFIYLKKRAKTA
ncbi:MAG: helix-turn-helix transcriptional regulator [Oscillospiraceae bacterium]